jgi:hypothetical protein
MSWVVEAGVVAVEMTDSGFVTSVCDTGVAAGARVIDEGVTGARVVGEESREQRWWWEQDHTHKHPWKGTNRDHM